MEGKLINATIQGNIIKLSLDNEGRKDSIFFNILGEWSELVIGLERIDLRRTLIEAVKTNTMPNITSILNKKYIFEYKSTIYCVILNKSVEIQWNVNLKSKTIISVLFNGVDTNSKPFNLDDYSITYKSINMDILAVILESSKDSINVLFISGLTGRILRDFYVYSVDLSQKPSFAFFDNYFVLIFLKRVHNFTRSEAIVIEILKEPKEYSFEPVFVFK